MSELIAGLLFFLLLAPFIWFASGVIADLLWEMNNNFIFGAFILISMILVFIQ